MALDDLLGDFLIDYTDYHRWHSSEEACSITLNAELALIDVVT
jgi:hypothetical protein